MRLNSIRAGLGILLLAMVGVQLLTSPIVALSIEASVEIKPETLNLKRHGVITVFITEFSDPSYNVSDIDFESPIELRVVGAPGWAEPISCIVADGKLVVKFDASEVADLIRTTLGHMQPTPPPKAELVVKGTVSGVDFEGSDRIRVILP